MAFTPLNLSGTKSTSGFTPFGAAPTQPVRTTSPYGAVGDALNQFSTGVAKGELSTAKALATIGSTFLDNTIGRVTNAIKGKGFTAPTANDVSHPTSPIGQAASAFLAPQGTAQNVGFTSEKAAEFLIPGSAASKGEAGINALAQGIKSPFLAATTRIAGKAAVQGAAAGAVNFAQSGGDVKSSLQTAATAGVIRGGLATIGEGISALKLPERIYSTIFKNTSGDMLQQLKTGGIAALQRDDPEKYAAFVKAGVIHAGADGTPVINESLAKQALDAGLRGNTRTMADTVVAGALDSEHQAQNIAATYNGTVSFPEKQFVNVLKDVEAQYQDVGFGDISKQAGQLATKLTDNNGELSAPEALDMRRLLDKLRISTSFNQPAPKLSLTQSNFKALADAARQRVNSIPGMGDVMKQYSFNIDALEALAKEAARTGNNQILSLIDSIVLSGGLSSGAALPAATAGIVRKYLLTPGGKTMLASFLNHAGKAASPVTSSALEATSAAVPSLVGGQ